MIGRRWKSRVLGSCISEYRWSAVIDSVDSGALPLFLNLGGGLLEVSTSAGWNMVFPLEILGRLGKGSMSLLSTSCTPIEEEGAARSSKGWLLFLFETFSADTE